MNVKSFSAPYLKSLTEEGTFEGRLAVYNTVDEGGDVIEPGAFTKTLQESGGVVPLLWQHDTCQPIGVLHLTDSQTALNCKAQLVLSVPQARQAYDLIRAGVVKGLSIGYLAIKDAVAGEVRRLKELRLFEGSLVTFPMNLEAQVTAVKTAAPADNSEVLEAFRNARRDISDFYLRLIDGE
jgi:HK97 family phage prohead protease